MYICHCRAVTDRTIRATIESGATTAAEVRRRCGAGSVCGGCYPAVRALVAAHAVPDDCPLMSSIQTLGPGKTARGVRKSIICGVPSTTRILADAS